MVLIGFNYKQNKLSLLIGYFNQILILKNYTYLKKLEFTLFGIIKNIS